MHSYSEILHFTGDLVYVASVREKVLLATRRTLATSDPQDETVGDVVAGARGTRYRGTVTTAIRTQLQSGQAYVDISYIPYYLNDTATSSRQRTCRVRAENATGTQLVNGQRVIVTNLSIDIGRFSALVQKRHPKADFDPNKRFRLLTDQECKRFWLHRRPGLSIPDITKEQEHGQDWFKVPEDTFGCLFVLDEAHIHFDARSWAMNGLSLTYYNSQHRKFSDEVVFDGWKEKTPAPRRERGSLPR